MENRVTREDARKFLDMLDGMPGNYGKLREQLMAKAYPQTLVNLTPHEIVVLGDDGNVSQVLPAAPMRDCARVEFEDQETVIAGVPVRVRTCESITNIPDTQPNTYYIVSQMLAQCLVTDREDILTVDRQVRDYNGKVVGCRSLARVKKQVAK